MGSRSKIVATLPSLADYLTAEAHAQIGARRYSMEEVEATAGGSTLPPPAVMRVLKAAPRPLQARLEAHAACGVEGQGTGGLARSA